MLLFLVDLLLFSFFYLFSFIFRSRATSEGLVASCLKLMEKSNYSVSLSKLPQFVLYNLPLKNVKI